MKTSEEMAQSALMRIKVHQQQVMKRNQLIKQFLIVFASFSFVIGIGLFSQKPFSSEPGQNLMIDDSHSIGNNYGGNQTGGLQKLYYNEATIKKEFHFDSLFSHQVKLNQNEIMDYYGKDFYQVFDDLKQSNKFVINKNLKGEIVEDQIVLETDKGLTIYASKLHEPNDLKIEYHTQVISTIYLENKKISFILGKTDKSICTHFKYQDIYYQIIGQVSEEVFIDALSSLFKE